MVKLHMLVNAARWLVFVDTGPDMACIAVVKMVKSSKCVVVI